MKQPQRMVKPMDYIVFTTKYGKKTVGILIEPLQLQKVVYFDGKRVKMVDYKSITPIKMYRHWIYDAQKTGFKMQQLVFSLVDSKTNKKFLKTLNNKSNPAIVLAYLIASVSIEYPEAYNDSRLTLSKLFDPSRGFSEAAL